MLPGLGPTLPRGVMAPGAGGVPGRRRGCGRGCWACGGVVLGSPRAPDPQGARSTERHRAEAEAETMDVEGEGEAFGLGRSAVRLWKDLGAKGLCGLEVRGGRSAGSWVGSSGSSRCGVQGGSTGVAAVGAGDCCCRKSSGTGVAGGSGRCSARGERPADGETSGPAGAVAEGSMRRRSTAPLPCPTALPLCPWPLLLLLQVATAVPLSSCNPCRWPPLCSSG